jgi:hypothetical protein
VSGAVLAVTMQLLMDACKLCMARDSAQGWACCEMALAGSCVPKSAALCADCSRSSVGLCTSLAAVCGRCVACGFGDGLDCSPVPSCILLGQLAWDSCNASLL